MLAYLEELELSKPVLYCGDMNVAHQEIDLANPKPNVGKHGFTDEEREGFQNYLDAGFVDTFRAASLKNWRVQLVDTLGKCQSAKCWLAD